MKLVQTALAGLAAATLGGADATVLGGADATVPGGADAEPYVFDRYDVATDATGRQTVLTGYLLGGASAELALVGRDAPGAAPRLRVYAFDGDGWSPRLDAPLPAETRFVDIASIGGRDRLIGAGGGAAVFWFDPDSASERPLAEAATRFQATPDAAIPVVDITRDLNRDGRDDLLIPDFDGFWIALQGANGSFSPPRKIGPPEPFLTARAVGDENPYRQSGISATTIPWYLSRVHELDYDGDGRSDLAFWNGNRFDVYRQTADGSFAEAPEPFAVDVAFDSDGTYSLIFGYAEETVRSLILGFKGRRSRTVLHSFGDAAPVHVHHHAEGYQMPMHPPRMLGCPGSACYNDLNGDGVADMVTLTMLGRSVLGQRTRYAVHFGRRAGGGLRFDAEPDAVIHSRRMQHGIEPRDVDGDGRADIVATAIDVRLRRLAIGFLTNSFAWHVEVYRQEDGGYPDKPSVRRRVKGGFYSGFTPAVLVGDVNGDGRADLLAGKDRQRLNVYLGVAGGEVFARSPRTVAVELPREPGGSRLADLNRDGKEDLVLHHASDAEPHRLTLLIGR